MRHQDVSPQTDDRLLFILFVPRLRGAKTALELGPARPAPAAACARPSWISFSLASEMLCVAARGGGGRNTASSALCAAANCEIASRRTLDLCGSLSATSPTPGSCRAAAGLSARAITSLDGMMLCYPLSLTYECAGSRRPLELGSVPGCQQIPAKNPNARTKPKRPSRPV